ncbi:MAG: signal recognition particle-docking protein FtsY [Treponema sp.]|nr:signal recognition particle-docking protein FtsY [Treponema sp.]
MAKLSFAEKLKSLFGGKTIDAEFFDDLTDALVEGDIGAKTAFQLTDDLQKICKEKRLTEEKDIRSELKNMLKGFAKSLTLEPEKGKTTIYMLLGVNGVGKTTTAAKLARHYAKSGEVILAAADTFRAAAEEQLEMHGGRLGIRVISHQHGSDPSAVVFDAADAARAKGGALVLADTAGRLHNKDNLVRELQKIDRIASQKADPGCYKKLLVIDATTGQNAVRQAEVFHEAVGLDAVVLTKYDSTAKGGVAFSVGKEFGIPVAFVCTGEGYDDIQPFDPDSYTEEFLG